MYCKNCGRVNKEDSNYCQYCDTKLESNTNNIERKKTWIFILIGVVVLIFLSGILIIVTNQVGESDEEVVEYATGKDKLVLISERAETETGDLIYEIKYEYNKYGEEIARVAYDAYGNEDDRCLKYAGDLQPFLKNYLRMEIEEGEQNTGYFTMEEDYIYTYNQRGYLTRCDFLRDNELNIYAIIFEYETIKVQDTAKDKDEQDGTEQENEELGVVLEENTNVLKNKLMDDIGIINVSGEECYALWGETGALVWKYVDATFEEEAYIASSFAYDLSDMIFSDGADPSEWGWDAQRVLNWDKWTGWEEFTPIHIGDDIFLFEGYLYGEYYYGYYIDAKNGKNVKTTVELDDEKDSFTRLTNFNDGFAVGVYNDVYYTGYGNHTSENYYLAVINKNCNLTISDIYVTRIWDNVLGEYSDGVIYCNGIFYDIEFNSILDISDKDWGAVYDNRNVYTPYFKDGVCTLITYKNDKYWIFDINKSGKILTDIKEFDLNELNY